MGWPPGTVCGVVADHVDHIRPLSTYPAGPQREAARYDHGNVQPLCVACHQLKTEDEARTARRFRRAQDTTGQLW